MAAHSAVRVPVIDLKNKQEHNMIDIGRVCIKTAGRDAGKQCVIVDIVDDTFVLIDGETRRRKCNVMHLEPIDKKINVKKGASHDDVVKVFKTELKIDVVEKKSKTAGPKPAKKTRKKRVKAPVKKAAPKKAEPKEEKKVEKPAEETKA